MEKAKPVDQKLWRALFFLNCLLILSLIGIVYWVLNLGMIQNSKEMLREKITEKQVYLENSGYIDLVNNAKSSLVSVVDKSGKEQPITGVILSNDGFVLIGKTLVKERLTEIKAIDTFGESYDLEWLGEQNGFTLAKLWLNGQMALSKEKRDSLFKFKSVLLADLEKQVAGQRLVFLKADLGAGIKLVGETLIAKNNYETIQPTLQQFGQRFVELELTDDSKDPKVIFNLGGEMVLFVNVDGEYLSSTEVNGILGRFDLNKGLSDQSALLNFGLSCVNLDKKWVFKYKFAADYGCLVGKGISEVGKSFPGGINKGSTAEKIGLKDGDLIIEFDNKLLLDGNMLDDFLTKAKGDQLFFRVIRDGKVLELKGDLL
ncbi:PDZ domain-containing protein [Candidatus Peregrinibacteria bacterium]|nr:PDZ domain-containing protein [Candidatus Peregrinibacteria bacterium]